MTPKAIDKALVYDHKGNLIEIDVDALEVILYKLRPRQVGETPAERVAAVQEAAQALLKWRAEAVVAARIEGRVYGFSQLLHYNNVPPEVKDKIKDRIKQLEGAE